MRALTRKGLLLAFISIAAMASGMAAGNGLLYFSGLSGLLLVLHAYSEASRWSRALEALEIERVNPVVRVNEGAEARIGVIIRNKSRYRLPRLTLKEHAPPRAGVGDGYINGVGPGMEALTWIRARPAPGSTRWSRVEVVASDPLSIAVAYTFRDVEARIHSYPNPWESGVNARLAPIGYGKPLRAPSRLGMEFLELREYREGDDPRLIHWPSTARLGTLIVRENRAESRVNITVILDHGREMFIGTPGKAPVDHALRLVAGLASIVSRLGGALYLYPFNGLKCMEPKTLHSGSAYTLSLEILSRIEQGAFRDVEGLIECISRASRQHPHSILVVLTGPGMDWGKLALGIVDNARGAPVRFLGVAMPTGQTGIEELIRVHEAERLEGILHNRPRGLWIGYGSAEDLARVLAGAVMPWI